MPSDQFHRVEKLTGECEQIRYIGTKDNPSFENSWTNVVGFNTGFYKDKFNRVWLSGGLYNGDPVGSTAFTLPEGYRPKENIYQICLQSSGSEGTYLYITAAGLVQPTHSGVVGSKNVHIDGVSWRV